MLCLGKQESKDRKPPAMNSALHLKKKVISVANFRTSDTNLHLMCLLR